MDAQLSTARAWIGEVLELLEEQMQGANVHWHSVMKRGDQFLRDSVAAQAAHDGVCGRMGAALSSAEGHE